MVAIFVISAQPPLPGAEDEVLDTFLKKFMHAGAYALLARVYLRGLRTTRLTPRQAWLMAWILAGVYALSDEVHQGYVPGRHGRVEDWVIDLCGAGIGLLSLGWPRRSVRAELVAQGECPQTAGVERPARPVV